MLLDLIGAASPSFHNMFTETTNLYDRLARIGTCMYVYYTTCTCMYDSQ